jgi:hypothetical protein
MADQTPSTDAPSAETPAATVESANPPKSKKPLLIGGIAVAVLAAAGLCLDRLREARAREGARLAAILLERVDRLRELAKINSKLRFHAQLNMFKGEWQFFLPAGDWILEND